MKALVWTGPEVAKIMNYDKPVPTLNEVLIKVIATGICGSELSGYLGQNSLRVPPLIMGHEFIGIVEAIGKGTKKIKVGQKVVVNPLITCGRCSKCEADEDNLCLNFRLLGAHVSGSFAEYVCVDENACYVVDDNFTAIEGTLVEPLACSVRACYLGGIRTGSTVAIFGAGIIGLTALYVAKRKGAGEVVIIDTNNERLEIAKEWGADKVITSIESLGNNKGQFDVVIDAVGLEITRNQSIEVIQPGGTVIFIGLHTDSTNLLGNTIVRSEINIKGSFSYTKKNFKEAISYMETGFVKNLSDDWYDERPLGDGDNAFKELISGSNYAKIILKPE